VEQLLEKKKSMHLTSAQLLADEVKAKMELLAVSNESKERLKRDASAGNCTLQDLCDRINKQCDAIVQRHKSMDSSSYVDDNSFRGLVAEILNMKLWATEQWQLWQKDKSQFIFNHLHICSLLDCHRMWLGHLRKRICEAAPDSDDRRLACLELLQSKGLVKAAAHGEPNAAGEDLIVAAGAEGWGAEDIGALLGAGADVSTADNSGKTGVWNAASCDHASTLSALLSAGGNADAKTNDGVSALWISAMNGHSACVETLIGAKADMLQCNS
jgi:hypothetical protein